MEILVSPGTIMPRGCDECPQDTYCSVRCATLCADWCRVDANVDCVVNENDCIILWKEDSVLLPSFPICQYQCH